MNWSDNPAQRKNKENALRQWDLNRSSTLDEYTKSAQTVRKRHRLQDDKMDFLEVSGDVL